jgi:hypothetical protein
VKCRKTIIDCRLFEVHHDIPNLEECSKKVYDVSSSPIQEVHAGGWTRFADGDKIKK